MKSKSRKRTLRKWKEVKDKRKKKCTSMCSHCRFFNKFLIHAKDFSSSLYRALKNMRTIRFVKEFEFVNCQFSIRDSVISCVIRGYKSCPNWKSIKWVDIKCRTLSRNMKISPCSIGSKRNKKVFFRKAIDLKSYILGLKSGKISLQEHNDLFKTCQQTLGNRFINSNREVKLLHFKQR